MAGDWGESGEGVDDALTRAIIDAIIKVHKVLGAGFGEAIYRRALVVELKKQNISVATEVDVSAAYEGQSSVNICGSVGELRPAQGRRSKGRLPSIPNHPPDLLIFDVAPDLG